MAIKRRKKALLREWQRLGRRVMRLWQRSGGQDPRIDEVFREMDRVSHKLGQL